MAELNCPNPDSNSNMPNGQSITPKPKLRVLSLFDGISTISVVLNKMEFDVEVYYASEIDLDAMIIAATNFENICHLGPVKHIDKETLDRLGEINLLVGRSHRHDLLPDNPSPDGRLLFDTEGTDAAFFEFYHIWKLLKLRNTQFYWLFESPIYIGKKNKLIISRLLKSSCFALDSVNISALRCTRLYWSNVPHIEELEVKFKDINSYGPFLGEFLNTNLGRRANVFKCYALTTDPTTSQDCGVILPVRVNGENTTLFVTEIEAILGFPVHYTDHGHAENSKKEQLLRKAGIVPVIEHIFKPLAKIFCLKQNSYK